MGHSFVSKMGN